ncbi:MAG TPA: alcohol dehydrogenase catalytic domain-containing protein, partial [Bacillota bacterium]|nr:alcohol dehydrogenase catalytic domain-containing protein [Bacillota bacterium]
ANLPKIAALKVLGALSKKFYYTRLSPVVYRDLPDQPLPGENWVKVRNVLTGICGTDLSFFLLKPDFRAALAAMPGSERTYLGHEQVGVVEEVGSGVQNLKPGDRVTMQKYMACCDLKEIDPPCTFCRQGLYCLCENYGEEGPRPLKNLGAGFGDYFLAPEKQLVKIPPDLGDDQAVMLEPAAVSLHAVLRRPPRDGEKILVFGGGAIGLNVIQCLKMLNPSCRVYLLERVKSKQEFGLRLGADEVLTGDPYEAVAAAVGGKLYRGPLGNKMIMGGFDVIFDCVGTAQTFHDSLRWLKARGTYVKIGHHIRPAAFDETPIWWQELEIIGINAHGMEEFDGRRISTFDLVIELARQGRYKLEGFITHRFKLDQYKEAFRTMIERSEEVIKVVLEIQPPE